MGRKTERAPLVLGADQRERLEALTRSHTVPVREARRARIMLGYAGGGSLSSIARELGCRA